MLGFLTIITIHLSGRFCLSFLFQAWRDAIANVKAQLGHQDNRLMNAEVGEIGLGGLWLQQNTIVEQITKRYTAETEAMSRTIRETNKARQAMQVKAYPELKKLNHKRETALQRKFMCQQAYNRVKGIMQGECALINPSR